MTCIVGVEHNGGVTLGTDSMISDPWMGQTLRPAYKIWKRGEWVYGGAGSLRALQIVRYIFSAPQLPDDEDDDTLEEYLVTEWSEQLRETFNSAGAQKIKHEVQETPDSWYLFGVRGRLYVMQPDYAVYRNDRGYRAIGSGEQYALGALEALRTSRSSAESKIETALTAAALYSPTVGAPFHYVTTHEEEDEA